MNNCTGRKGGTSGAGVLVLGQSLPYSAFLGIWEWDGPLGVSMGWIFGENLEGRFSERE